MIAIRGANSKIVEALLGLLPVDELVYRIDRRRPAPFDADRYLFCQGLLSPKRIVDQDDEAIAESFLVNAGRVIQECDRIFDANERARICVIGSESGFTGSFDGAYSASKAALHRYCETKQLRTPKQQLVCVAPTIISDAGMTMRRTDHKNLVERRMEHPKKRWLTVIEVAKVIHFVLYEDLGFLSGVVIRMNGGAHAQRGK